MAYVSKFIQAYDHDGRIGVLVEFTINGGSIIVRMPEFLDLAKDIAMHIAASNPDNDKTLLGQPFVKDTTISVAEHLAQVSARLHEEIAITRFVRWDDQPTRPDIPPHRPANVVRMRGRE
jgi:elongation factor Ts